MRVTGDLGFSSLVLVVLCLVVPVIGFVIRRKWLHAVARKEEIKRLLILASEEAERAEQEASYVYGTVSVVKSSQCVVCYCPTTTRCARCKAVRYCSGKCQIIHWRQGHREECRPPSTTPQIDNVVGVLGQNAVEQNHLGIHGEKSEIEGTQSKTSFKEPPLSDSGCSPEVSCAKDDNIRVEPLAEVNITDSNSESSSNSFSGFSASAGSSESSDDASVCESIISNENERSEGHDFVDPALELLDTTSSDDNSTGENISSSPKFARLVDSVDGFSTTSKLNQIRPGFSSEVSKIASNGTSSLNMCKGTTIEPCTVSSGFWDKSLNSRGNKDVANDDTAQCNSNQYSVTKESDSGSSFGFSFSTLPSSLAQVSEAQSSISGNASANSVGNNVPSAGSALSENSGMDSSKTRNFLSINSKGSGVMNHGTANGSDRLESREDNFETFSSSYVRQYSNVGEDSKYKDPFRTSSNLQSAGSKASNHVVENPGGTSHQLKSCASANARIASRTEGRSHHRSKSGNYGVQAGIITSSQCAICSPNSKNGLKTSVLKVVDQFRGSTLSKRFPPASGNDVVGRYTDKGIFPYDLFVKLYNWNKVEVQPFGLINCGNSCYANAVLQCLAFTPPLTAYLLQGLHSKACAKKKWCFMCEFESLILKSKEGKSPLSPMGILSQLQNIGSQLGNGRQEDAHEFLRHAIDTMQSACLMEAGINASSLFEEETTLMGLTFGGYLRSKIKCMKCGGTSERQERMMDLTVEIEGEITTLEEALRRFTSTETLDGENKYHCARCKSYEKAKKKLTVSEAPNVLTVALKRFQCGKFGKLNKPIRFPEILDLAPYMSGTSDKSPIYRLYGVVVHLDIMNAAFSGHYVCYVKNIQNKWFKVDDSMVTAVELERVLTKGAYMLLYARCSPRAPRSIRSMVFSLDTKSKAVNGKTSTITSRRASKISDAADAAEYSTSSVSADGSPALDSFYSRFHHLKRILEEDSSSDNSSLISSNSDEGSCSTDSTCGSTSTDDFSDYFFGDSVRGCSSVWRNSHSDTSSSSSSPISSRHSPLADMDRYASGSHETELQNQTGTSMEEDGPLDSHSNGVSRVEDIERKGVSLLHSDNTTRHRKLDGSRSSSSSNFRDTDSLQRLGANHFNDVNSDVSGRKSRERTD